MTDQELLERISRDLDGDLPAAERERLAADLAADPLLRAERDALARTRKAVAALASRDEPPGRLDLVIEPLLSAPRGASRGGPARWFAAVAATAALAIVGWWVAAPGSGNGVGEPTARQLPVEASRSDPTTRRARGGDLHAALRRGELPEMPQPDAPPPLEVIGPLPFPPELFGGKDGRLALAGAATIPVRVPAACPSGDHAVIAVGIRDGIGDLRVLSGDGRSLVGCSPLVALEPVPSDVGRTLALLTVS